MDRTNWFGSDFIKDLAANREFAGSEWFRWLDKRKIPFFIKIKKNALVNSSKGNNLHVRRLFINLKPDQTRFLSKKKDIFDMPLWLAAPRAQDGEWIIVATNHEHENALIRHKLRWNIEILFGFLKSGGVNFEDTHYAHERLHNLLSVLIFAFCLAYKTGQIVVDEIPIKNKKHGRPEKSVLRVGLDLLRELFFKIERSFDSFSGDLMSIFNKNRTVDLIFSGG